MKGFTLSLVVLALAAILHEAVAADWKQLKGTYAITAENYLDPSEGEPKDSHLRFQLSGDAAKDLYRAMKVKEKLDECSGTTAKEVGAMKCLFSRSEQTYMCHFAIDVMQQKIEHGIAC